MSKWKWIAASRRGTSHERSDTHRQDAYRCVVSRYGRLIAAVSDGAGSASHSRYGAVITCRLLTNRARAYGRVPSRGLFEEWIDELRDTIATTAARHDLQMRDFAATMLFAMSDARSLFIAHIGDGAIVRQDDPDGLWECVSWPESGEYASTTFFVTDNAGVRLRTATFEHSPHALALFSDGIERLVLDFASQTAPSGFFDTMSRAMKDSELPGAQRALSRQLHSYLGTPKINERTDDDKTMIVAVRR
ncbi:PP2C family serine/threonine-protein phosphatase [Mesorhizobium sp. Cs1299R1N3]|uniref:PP2C family serine/threonine-protein phosphatase n=1 Tax=Mesorhizobium sp. Cs1299R1N3 TaxID=3015173 RepID=UPI00301DBAA0